MIKQRLARPGEGRSGGYRAILFCCQTQWTFFIYGFAKSERDNIDDNEETYFKRAAKHVLGLSEEHLAEMIAKGQFLEVNSDG